MKKIYNDFTKNDLPLDFSYDLSKKQGASKGSKTKINVISSKKSSKTSSKASSKTAKNSLNKNSISNKDLEKLNEENLKTAGFRTRRNRVIIIILIILLLLSFGSIGAYYYFTNMESNCFFNITGNSSGTLYIDGKQINEFKCPSDMRGGARFEFLVELELDQGSSYDIEFYCEVFQNDEKLTNIVMYEPNRDLFVYKTGTKYASKKDIVATNSKITLCKGIVIGDEYTNGLNVNNFTMNFYIKINKK